MSLTDRAGLDALVPDRTVISVGSHRARLPGARQISTTNLAGTLQGLAVELRRRIPAPAGHQVIAVETLDPPEHTDRERRADLATIMRAIGDRLPPEAIVLADAGDTGAGAIHYLPLTTSRFGVALGMGGMGYAIAAAVGVAISLTAHPERRYARTVVIAGDGSFLMHGMEIHTAIEYQAPVTVIVLNNNAHGMCVTREQLYFPETAGLNTFGATDIAAGVAAMFGSLPVYRVSARAGLETSLAEVFAHHGPNCLVIDTDPDEVAPFLPFRKGPR